MSTDIETFKLMLSRCEVTQLNRELKNACRGGHLDFVNLLISYGANDLDGGLRNACRGGHLDIVKLLV